MVSLILNDSLSAAAHDESAELRGPKLCARPQNIDERSLLSCRMFVNLHLSLLYIRTCVHNTSR